MTKSYGQDDDIADMGHGTPGGPGADTMPGEAPLWFVREHYALKAQKAELVGALEYIKRTADDVEAGLSALTGISEVARTAIEKARKGA